MSGELERVLDDGYLGDLRSVPFDEVRSRRSECQALESGLSLARRIVQARFDIVGQELRRRAEGDAPLDLADLIGRLPDLLAEHTRAEAGRGAPVRAQVEPLLAGLGAELDGILDDAVLVNLPTLPDEELSSMASALEALERRISGQRRELHARIDVLQAEVVRRYREGETSVDDLLRRR